eukprot:TRINITY_DN68715_c0_g1_i1.p2 TRINITY_DN68715_c0_g1~~TRINITY_DN68715_c0_g1_i1.p2  ORF type:complete len:155 (-),score=15.54 TRINITY_DN68715_c0_g1_i1:301-765(-)
MPGLYPPATFQQVSDRIARSVAPSPLHYPFIKSFRFKKIVYVDDSPPPAELCEFLEREKIELRSFQLPSNPHNFTKTDMGEVVQLLLNNDCPTAPPLLLVHQKGVPTAGVIVACLRRIQNWSFGATINEYDRYFPCETDKNTVMRQFVEDFSFF